MAEEKKPFKVTISDEDYLSPDELDNLFNELENKTEEKPNGAKPKFEVHIDDEDLFDQSFDDSKPRYNGEIYFSNVKPVRTQPVQTQQPKPLPKKVAGNGVLALFLAIVIAFAGFFSVVGISCLNDVVAFHRSEEEVTVTIPNDADTNDIIDILSSEGLIKQKLFCKLFYSFTYFVKNINKTNKTEPVYLSGVYDVSKNMGLEGYLSEFKETQKGKETIRVTIPEGWCSYQIFDKLEKFEVCKKSKLISSINGTDFAYDFLKLIPKAQSRTFKLEGYLYPDTYDFYVDSDPNSVIRKLLDGAENHWSDKYDKRAKELGYSMDEILTIASIIQREAADTEQMKLISSVLHNRLKHSASWPTINCDSTQTYIDKFVADNVDPVSAMNFSRAYNTYDNGGLPPGPICNPGDDAINAALYPDSTNYYFFRHDKYGKIYMAVTQAEHDRNANLVLRANNS